MSSFFFPTITSFNHLMRGQYAVEDEAWCMGAAVPFCSWHPYSNGVVDAEDSFSKIDGGRRVAASYADAMKAYFDKFSPKADTFEALMKVGAEAVYWTERVDACERIDIYHVAKLRGLFVQHQTDYPFGACGVEPPANHASPDAWRETIIAHSERMQRAREAGLEQANDLDTELTNVKKPNITAVKARYTYAVADRASLFRDVDGSLQRGGGQDELIADILRSFQKLKRGERPQGVGYEQDDGVYLGRRPTKEVLDYANLAKLHLADLELEWTGDWKKATGWLAAIEEGNLSLKKMHALFHAISQAMTKDMAIAEMRQHLKMAGTMFDKLFLLATNANTPPEARTILLSLLEKAKDVLGYALTLYDQHPQQTPKTKKADPLLQQRKKMRIPRCLPYQNIGTQSVSLC